MMMYNFARVVSEKIELFQEIYGENELDWIPILINDLENEINFNNDKNKYYQHVIKLFYDKMDKLSG